MSEREFDAYLRLLGGLLRLAPEQREQIAGELRDHMEDRLEALLAAGVPREEAIGQALEEFGDVAALAASFREIAWNRRRKWIMRYTAASVVSMLMIILVATAFWPGDPAGPGVLANARAQDEGEASQPANQTPEARNAATRAILNQTRDFPFAGGVPLTVFVDQLENDLGVEIYVDVRELEMVGIDPDVATVDIVLSDARASMALDLIFTQLECGYYLRDGFICITSAEKAMTMAEIRVYECGHILDAVPASQPSVALSTAAGNGKADSADEAKKSAYVTTSPNAETLISIIVATVDPYSWNTVGGMGNIAEYDGKLVVRQTDSAHAQIQYLLDNLDHGVSGSGTSSAQLKLASPVLQNN